MLQDGFSLKKGSDFDDLDELLHLSGRCKGDKFVPGVKGQFMPMDEAPI